MDGGTGEASAALFWKLEKGALILENNALILSIYGLSFLLKVLYKSMEWFLSLYERINFSKDKL